MCDVNNVGIVDKFIRGKKASEILGIHQRTLYVWETKGWIETKRTRGNARLYNVDKCLREMNLTKQNNAAKNCLTDAEIDKLHETKIKLNISYVRVSSLGQKDDLERQEQMVRNKYPNNLIIKDIGSGLNLNRRGLNKIIELAIEGKINKVIVAYKDRLTRFGYDLIEKIITKYSKGEIVIINKKEDMAPEEELTRDVLELMNVFVAKMNGLRKYKKKDEKIEIIT